MGHNPGMTPRFLKYCIDYQPGFLNKPRPVNEAYWIDRAAAQGRELHSLMENPQWDQLWTLVPEDASAKSISLFLSRFEALLMGNENNVERALAQIQKEIQEKGWKK